MITIEAKFAGFPDGAKILLTSTSGQQIMLVVSAEAAPLSSDVKDLIDKALADGARVGEYNAGIILPDAVWSTLK